MDIQTFSTTYWYIWLLVILLIVIFISLNGLGVLLYCKKRRKFLNQSNRINDRIPMQDTSEISIINTDRSEYRRMSIPSTITSGYPSSCIRKSKQIMNSITSQGIWETSRSELHSSSNEMIKKSHIDLSLEEFRQQALHEHNSMRILHNKSPLKLTESLNIYAQHWAEQCARTNIITPSRPEWRLKCKGQPIGENIISIKSTNIFDGNHFTSLLMANSNQSNEVDCIRNEIITEVGFGRGYSPSNDDRQQAQWIGVAHYYPYRQLTAVQS